MESSRTTLGPQDDFGRLTILGLLNWRESRFGAVDSEKLAGDLLGKDRASKPPIDEIRLPGGWYGVVRKLNFGKEIGELDLRIGVAHSRVIAEVTLPASGAPTDFHGLRAYRDIIESPILKQLSQALDGCNRLGSPPWKGHLPASPDEAFLFVYPVYTVSPKSTFYKREFPVDSHLRTGRSPPESVNDRFELSTSSFFLSLTDDVAWFSWPQVYLRMSGASLVMSDCSKALLQRLIDIVFFAGLYPATIPELVPGGGTNPTKINANCNWVHHGLDAVKIQPQLQELTRKLEDEIVERRLERLTYALLILSAVVAVATIVGIVVR